MTTRFSVEYMEYLARNTANGYFHMQKNRIARMHEFSIDLEEHWDYAVGNFLYEHSDELEALKCRDDAREWMQTELSRLGGLAELERLEEAGQAFQLCHKNEDFLGGYDMFMSRKEDFDELGITLPEEWLAAHEQSELAKVVASTGSRKGGRL